MDTKLINYKAGATTYGLLFFLETMLIGATIIAGSVSVALGNMRWMSETEGWYLSGTIKNQARFEHMENVIGMSGIGAILVAIGLFVLLAVMVGRSTKNQYGEFKLTWFDRIWSEAQLVLGGFAISLIAVVTRQMYYMWIRGKYLGVWKSDEGTHTSFVSDEVELTFCIAAMFVGCFVVMLCALSLIKKLKAKQFWEKSLLGGAFLAIYRSIKSSDKTLIKVLAIVIVSAFLSATWVGLPVVLVAALIFVPTLVKKFTAIKVGVEEVKNGHLDYKIPMDENAKGGKGEFDRLAERINEISEASSIAVQNELKNQRMKTDLISNVSHDLKTPLTSMISYIDLLQTEGLDSPNAPEYLDIVDKKTQRLKVLTENLFDAAKASSGAMPVNMEAIDLSSLLTQSLAEMEERLTSRGLEIQVKNNCEDGHVMADGQLMWRVLENLLGNISKYAMERSRVYIDMYELESRGKDAEDLIVLEVKNVSQDPLNISADELTERFKRGDDSRNTEGSGLGLAIAKDLVKLMDGVFEIFIDGDLFKATVMMKKAK